MLHCSIYTAIEVRSRHASVNRHFWRSPDVTPYGDKQITDAQFKTDEPSSVLNQLTHVTIDGVPATMFYCSNSIMGDTREIWFIHGGFLHEVTTYKQLDSWLAPIMQPWQFTP